MEPTLRSGQYLVINKLAYVADEPQRGDIVVLRFPRDPRRDFIKRIVALPGEEVAVRGGVVYVNGRSLEEPYLFAEPAYEFAKAQVPPDSYFVLGDNRNSSSDSHAWGFLSREYLIGKAWVSYWPVDSWGVLQDGSERFATASPAGSARAEHESTPASGDRPSGSALAGVHPHLPVSSPSIPR